MATVGAIKDVDKTANIFNALMQTIMAHPIVFMCVVLSIAFIVCLLPNGVVKALIEMNVEKKKLNERVDQSRKKLTSNRQNRKR